MSKTNLKIRLAISTCPNDTFMFDAAVNGRIDTEGLVFELHLTDIEELNLAAKEGIYDVTKLSYAVYPLIAGRYKIVNSGSALGRGNGPLLVSRRKIYTDEMADASVAIPGKHTTANLLMERLFPEVKQKRQYLFCDVAQVVMSGECDAGVLIHEGRFVYQKIGLRLIADLGVEWEKRTSMPLPLGAIVVSKELDAETQRLIERVIRRSIEYAMANPAASECFVKQYARELDGDVIEQHICLFVNEYSLDLGPEGREAVKSLLDIDDDGIFV